MKKFEEIRKHLTDWLKFHQLNDIFKLDKRKGFATEIPKLEKDLLQSKDKLLSKKYRLLLAWEVMKEVKSVMIQ